jgi:uncharacterized protein
MQLVLQVTRDCNFACTYCYQRHRKGSVMPAEVAERALRFVLEEPDLAPGGRHVAVTYFGGEPRWSARLSPTSPPSWTSSTR